MRYLISVQIKHLVELILFCICQMISNFFCFPPKASQNNGSHLKMFPPKPQNISASAARLLGCFFMSALSHFISN